MLCNSQASKPQTQSITYDICDNKTIINIPDHIHPEELPANNCADWKATIDAASKIFNAQIVSEISRLRLSQNKAIKASRSIDIDFSDMLVNVFLSTIHEVFLYFVHDSRLCHLETSWCGVARLACWNMVLMMKLSNWLREYSENRKLSVVVALHGPCWAIIWPADMLMSASKKLL